MKKHVRYILSSAKDVYIRFSNLKLTHAFSCKSHLTTSERFYLYKFAKQQKIIAEIGSYVGASACCFSEGIKENNTGKIICIDTWNNDAMSEGNRDTWKEFQENIKPYKNFIIPIRGFSTSTDVLDDVRKISLTLDILFIDGDHSYEGVKADWEAYKSFLKEGTTVIFHDYGWAEGVKQVVHEDVMPLVNEYDSLPNMWWGKLAKTP